MTFFKTLFFSLLLLGISNTMAQDDKISEAQKAEIEKIIRSYILDHPEIIPEAIEVLQAREQEAEKLAVRAAINANRQLLENDGFSMVGGNPNGDVTIVEFYDYRCPFCARSHPDILKLLEEDKNLRIVYKQFPVKDRPGEPAISLKASQMAFAAERQGKFEEFHHLTIVEGSGLTELKLRVISNQIGLDKAQLEKDMADPLLIDYIRKSMNLAHSLGLNGTPSFIIGDEVIVGARGYDLLKDAVTRARASSSSSGQK